MSTLVEVTPDLRAQVDEIFACWALDCDEPATWLVRVSWSCPCDHLKATMICDRHLKQLQDMCSRQFMHRDGTLSSAFLDVELLK